MNMEEYNKIKDLDYQKYCDYLQKKYGIGLDNYMTPGFTKIKGVTRTNEGLFVHHKSEDEGILLSYPNIAKRYPYEYQKKENLVYCDYLEHIYLHVLIYKYPANYIIPVGIGGITLIAGDINDLYSGWRTEVPSQMWRMRCYEKIANDKDVYLAILKCFIQFVSHKNDAYKSLLTSSASKHGSWDKQNNASIFQEITGIAEEVYAERERRNEERRQRYKRMVKFDKHRDQVISKLAELGFDAVQDFPDFDEYYGISQNQNKDVILDTVEKSISYGFDISQYKGMTATNMTKVLICLENGVPKENAVKYASEYTRIGDLRNHFKDLKKKK